MTRLSEDLVAAAGIFRRDLRLYMSYRLRFITQLVATVFSLALFYYVSRLIEGGRFTGPDDYFGFVLVGIITLRVMASTLATPPQKLIEDTATGTFERTATSALGPVGGIVALLTFPFAVALVTALVGIAAGVVIFGLDLHWSSAPLFLPVALLGALAFAPLGIAMLAAVLVAKQATAASGFVITGLSLVSGLYFPVSVLPEWIRWMGDVQPFTPAAELARHVLLDRPLGHSPWVDAAKLAGFAIVLLPVAIWMLQRAVVITRRRGTLIEV